MLTGVATLATVAAAGPAASRGARLRRDEALWRQILEVEDDTLPPGRHRIVQDLHRHAVAQLVGRRLAPTESTVGIVLALGLSTIFPMALGVLVGYVGVRLEDMTPSDWTLLGPLGGLLLLISAVLTTGTAMQLAFDISARNALAAKVFKGEFPIVVPTGGSSTDRLAKYHHRHQPFLRLRLLLLGLAASVALAGAVGAFWANFSGGGPHYEVVAVCLAAYTAGLFFIVPLWVSVVVKSTDFESTTYEERVVSVDRALTRRWLRFVGLILGAAAGVLIGGILGAPIGGVLGAGMGYGFGAAAYDSRRPV
ncbi:hypothetical protein [Ornithinimicrobium flavum]|uniref:hypothetical protein n=1 Tax=Ornithinimicrobium flavum TaxID=1288636 RepID=UPI00106F932B|nr:hypothetical protein [Ornithinimicrobium flavum]